MLPRRLIDHSKRLLLLVGLSTTAAVLPRPTVARSSSSTGTGAGSGSGRAPGVGSHASCASGFATATPAGTSNAAAAKHSYSPRAHLYERPPEHLRLKVPSVEESLDARIVVWMDGLSIAINILPYQSIHINPKPRTPK